MYSVKNALLIVMLAVFGFAAPSVVRADDDTRKELEAVYAKIDKAIENKDIKTLEALLDEDYEKQSGDKTIKRPEAVAEMKKNLDAVKSVESNKTTIDKINQVEGNQIVDYTQVSKITITGDDGKDKTLTVTSKGRDWWVKGDDGKWICVAAERVD
jgi:ketosteroid isomerase-like protein